MSIVDMTTAQAPAVAQLHRKSIKVGLIVWLGQRFCERLYCALAENPYSFILLYEDEQYHPLQPEFFCNLLLYPGLLFEDCVDKIHHLS